MRNNLQVTLLLCFENFYILLLLIKIDCKYLKFLLYCQNFNKK